MASALITRRDPVCGMEIDIATSRYALTDGRELVHFCSQDCLRRFEQSPSIFEGGTLQPMPRRRTLRFVAPDSALLERARLRLARTRGVSQASVAGERLVVAYELAQMTLAQIEALLGAEGLTLKDGMHGALRSWWKFIEKNALANAMQPIQEHCCAHAPEPKIAAAEERNAAR